jgi:hypothetical protein
VKVTKEPADGVKRENCAIVLVRNRITTIAVRMVKGAASPAPCTIIAKPKKKLIAGAMLARVDATVCARESSFRRRRVSPPVFRLDTVSLADICAPGQLVLQSPPIPKYRRRGRSLHRAIWPPTVGSEILQGSCREIVLSLPHRTLGDISLTRRQLSRERRAYLSCAAWSAAAVVSEVTTGALFHSASSS